MRCKTLPLSIVTSAASRSGRHIAKDCVALYMHSHSWTCRTSFELVLLWITGTVKTYAVNGADQLFCKAASFVSK